jgi:DNA polymerase III epsilon subunit-like protein
METLLSCYDRILVLDTETTGFGYSRDDIIQFSAVALISFSRI